MNSEREGWKEKRERGREKLVFRISRPNCDYFCVSRGVFIFCLIRRTTIEYNLKVTKWKTLFRENATKCFNIAEKNTQKLPQFEVRRNFPRAREKFNAKNKRQNSKLSRIYKHSNLLKINFKGSTAMLFPFHFTFLSTRLKIELFFSFIMR